MLFPVAQSKVEKALEAAVRCLLPGIEYSDIKPNYQPSSVFSAFLQACALQVTINPFGDSEESAEKIPKNINFFEKIDKAISHYDLEPTGLILCIFMNFWWLTMTH